MALALFSAWLWRPERQVRLHTSHLLAAVEGRRWARVENFIADSYSDRWGHDKEFVLQGSKEVFGQFIFLTIQSETLSSSISGSLGTTSRRLKISGSGSPIAQMAMERVNQLREPFVFTWQQRSWKPWDWRLIRFDQPELDISETLEP